MRFGTPATALLAALLAPGPAAADWTPRQLSEFMDDCIHSCQNENPSVSAAKKPRCPEYCRCVVNAGQRRFTAADYARMDQDSRAKRDSADLRAFQRMFEPCMKGTIQ